MCLRESERFERRECVSERKWGGDWGTGKGGNTWKVREIISWKKKKQHQGRGKNETGGLEEALWRSDA